MASDPDRAGAEPRDERERSSGARKGGRTSIGKMVIRARTGDALSEKGRVYQAALEAVFAILLCLGIGYWADERYGTSPLYLLIGLVIGFGSFVLRIVRLRGPVDGDP